MSESTDSVLDGAYQQHLRALARYCERHVEIALEQDRKGAAIPPLMKHLSEVLDYEIAHARQRSGHNEIPSNAAGLADCDASAIATIPEAIAVADHLRQHLTQGQLQNLQVKNVDECPFFHDDRCLIYKVRPLLSRLGQGEENSRCKRMQDPVSAPNPAIRIDAAAHAVEHGLRVGLRFEGLDSEHVNLAKAVLAILRRPAFSQDYVDGRALLQEHKQPIANDPVKAFHVSGGARPASEPDEIGKEPTGYVPPIAERSLREYYDLALKQGLFKDAIQTLRLGTPAQEIARIVVPRVYNSQEEIAEWRESYVCALRAFAEQDYEPGDAFNAISMHRTASLAYQGMNDKEIMIENGKIMSGITERAFPEFLQPIPTRKRNGKIRLGYLSANMHGSNGCRWSLGWLANHGDNIETFAINVGTVQDKVTQQFMASADHYFHLVRSIPHNARFIRSLELDCLIITDIGLHGFNTSYATMRLAPIQATAWGHPVTSGYPEIDFYLSSELMEPPNGQEHYSERLVRLPNTGLCYSELEDFPRKTRSDFGLPEGGPLVVNVQTKPKLLPQHDHLYREIAEKAKTSIVFLEGPQPCDTIVTKRRMEKAGVPAIWIPHLRRLDFLALLELADVSLDPPLWSGGNTTIEALALGTPVVTLPGPFMRGRHSYAFLKQVYAEGLIAASEEDYIALAADFDRQREGMKSAEPRALFNDRSPVEFLDLFLEDCV